MSDEKYTCGECGGEFLKTIPDEEAKKEYKDNFPEKPFSEAEIVCDDCYKKIMDERICSHCGKDHLLDPTVICVFHDEGGKFCGGIFGF